MDVLKFLSGISIVLGALMAIISIIEGEYQTAIWAGNSTIWAGITNSLIDG